MIGFLFRILILVAVIFIIYTIIQYVRQPERQMRIAKELQEFYFVDEPKNIQKHLQFAYKGCLFEGEKHLGATEESFEVLTIQVSVREPLELKGITREDLYFLENELLIRYPYAKIEWRYPINELLITSME